MTQYLLVMLAAWCGLSAQAAGPTVGSSDSTRGLSSADHEHGGTIEAAAIHAAAEAWETSCGRLVVRTRPDGRIPGATRVGVTYKKGPTDRNGPKYTGIVVKGELYMGEDAVHAAVLGLWGASEGKKLAASDLAWLAEFGGRCSVTAGPTAKGGSECEGYEPTSVAHEDGRVGVRYWLRCRGGMRPNRSESKMVAWLNPDQSIERVREGMCSDGNFRPSGD